MEFSTWIKVMSKNLHLKTETNQAGDETHKNSSRENIGF